MENKRAFQLWFHQVSHSHMLIRQPKNCDDGYNTDYFFTSVEYVSFPTTLHGLMVTEADDEKTEEFLSNLQIEDGKAFQYGLKLFLLHCDEGLYYVVAGSMKRNETYCEIMDSSQYNALP